MRKEVAYFLSDAHLGQRISGGEERETVLLSFLEDIAPGSQALFIVGDLFDFWIEYKYAIFPAYFPTLSALYSLVKQGTEVHYCQGNHDFALGPFLKNLIGVTVHPDEFAASLQGKELRVLHGDGLRKGDIGNRLLRGILRNSVNQKLYKVLHPNIGIPLAKMFSALSRGYINQPASSRILEKYRQLAQGYLNRGDDIVVFGHTHQEELIRFKNGIYCNTGAWIQRYPFAQLENGEMTLWHYFPGQPPRQISTLSNQLMSNVKI